MIHREEPQLIEVRGLPQLFRNLEDIAAIAGLQRCAGDPYVLPRRPRGSICRVAAHYPQRHTQGTLPHHVGNEAEVCAIPRIEKRARALELLQLQHVLIGAGEVDGLRYAIGPLHAQDVRLEMAAESEMRHRLRDDAGLVQLAGTHLEPGADAERVVLAAAEAERSQADPHREVRVPAVVAEHVNAGLAAEDET